MTKRVLAMPDYVTRLIKLQLVGMGLQPDAEADAITCPLVYEDGSILSLVILCVAKRKWLLERPTLLISIASLDQRTRATEVYFRETTAIPTSASDLHFTIRLAAKIRAMAWSLATTGKMGECTSLPGRPPV